MINIGILYDKNVTMIGHKPFKGDNTYNKDYQKFIINGKKCGVNYVLAPYTEYKNKFFQQAWIFNKKWQKTRSQKLDIVFDKVDGLAAFALKKKIYRTMPLVNDYQFDLLCTDKWLSYKKWPKFFVKTVLGNNASAVKKFKTDLVVAKPRTGASGQGIKFIARKKYKKLPNKYIVQEFIKGGKILNYSGQHDYRLYIVNDKILFVSLRMPVKHKYLANVGKGGREIFFINKKIPKSILTIFNKIKHDLKKIRVKVYSLDFMIDENNRAYLIELNTRPGITHYFNEKIYKLIGINISKALKKYV